jgi:glycosyltransferase involved in cell wall biosynthesis
MIKIIHFSETLPGGPASYFEEIAGAQIEYFGKANIRFLIPRIHRCHVPSIPDECIVPFGPTSRGPLSLMRLGAVVRQVVRSFQPDILHLHSTFAGALARPPLLYKRYRPVVIYCAHGWAFTREESAVKRWAYAVVEQLLACATDKIINISDHEARAACLHGLPHEKMITIPNGVSQSFQRLGEAVDFDPNKINLLFVGRHDPQKGIDILLDAMRALYGYPLHLHVLGDSVLSKPRVKNGSERNVSYYGWTPRERVFDFIAAADAVIMPSRWEGFGLTVIEAMRMGKPAIVSNRGALPELVVDHVNGRIINIDAPQNVTNVLKSLNRSDLREMGKAAFDRYIGYYTAARMNRDLIGVYEDVLSR